MPTSNCQPVRILIIIIIGFLINVQVQGQHPHQWAPFQIAGLLHAWQLSGSHTRSPGTSIMRVDSRELPLSAVPLCQLLPCHFGPPRPTLSINLYVKGCLDCTTGAFHMSIPSKSSLLQNEAQILNAKPHKWIIGPGGDNVFAAWHCRSVWSLPCHFAADTGGSALSMAKSHWHGALRSAHKSCTHGHVFWKRGGMKRGLVADPWTSSRRFSHVLWLKVHSHLLLRACLLGSKRKLPPQACHVRPGLPSVVCHPRGVQFPGTVYIYSQGPFSSAWAHNPGFWYKSTYWMTNYADPDQLASSEANWSGSTLFVKAGHIWVQQHQG